MANLPANRTKLNAAIANQQPSIVASAQANREALIEAYDTVDLLFEMVNNLINTGYLSTAMVTNLNMNNKNITNIAAATLGNFQNVVISGGAITVTKTHHRIDTSGGPGELSTINGGSDGQLLLLRATSNSRPITIKHGVGNIATNDNQDVVLTNSNNSHLLVCVSNYWYVIGNVGVRRDGDTMGGNLTTPLIRYGSGSPEGVVTAGVGTWYARTNGGAGTSMYVKESGTGNTGWAAK